MSWNIEVSDAAHEDLRDIYGEGGSPFLACAFGADDLGRLWRNAARPRAAPQVVLSRLATND